jgi:hypothetical protein
MTSVKYAICCCAVLSLLSRPGLAQEESDASDESAELAKSLQNPIADLIILPIQYNYDIDIGPNDDGSRHLTYFQPVYPFRLNEDWNLISRTILPIIQQEDVPAKGMHETGVGDITQSLFFSPVERTENGWIWGAGPVMLLPTASDDFLGSENWGLGPTVVGLKQEGPWTVGALANHVWTLASESGRSDVDATYVEPWVTYTTQSNTSISMTVETTYDWEAQEATIPVNFIVDQLFEVGGQYVSIAPAVYYYLDSPDEGPEGFGFRLQMTLLFPK